MMRLPSWLSAKTGETWRLPTDEEWVFAEGSRFHDDALSVAASRDPSVRWLARYEKESEQETLDQRYFLDIVLKPTRID
jgi:formylglycine-generating enzyme required for sulfatase activity